MEYHFMTQITLVKISEQVKKNSIIIQQKTGLIRQMI